MSSSLLTSPSTVAKRLARHFTFGRSRVLTPVPPDQVWVFFRGFPTPSHCGMSHITEKANAGSVSTSQYLPPSFRTHPHPSRIFPSMWLKRLWKASAIKNNLILVWKNFYFYSFRPRRSSDPNSQLSLLHVGFCFH
jgi:hypothetical protein